jgi:hypothetical protein
MTMKPLLTHYLTKSFHFENGPKEENQDKNPRF